MIIKQYTNVVVMKKIGEYLVMLIYVIFIVIHLEKEKDIVMNVGMRCKMSEFDEMKKLVFKVCKRCWHVGCEAEPDGTLKCILCGAVN